MYCFHSYVTLGHCWAGTFIQRAKLMESPRCSFSLTGSFSAESFFSPVLEVSGWKETFRTDCSLSNQRAWQQDGEQCPLGRKEGSTTSWPSLESDHQQPFHTPLPFQCQQDIPSWDTRRFSCLAQHTLLSASFIWNAKRGATGGSVSPRIKELLWRVPFLFLFFPLSLSVCASVSMYVSAGIFTKQLITIQHSR